MDNYEDDADADVFAESERKRLKYTRDEDHDENENLNFFQLMLRSALADHKSKCQEVDCKSCEVDIDSSFSWNERFRYSTLHRKYAGKTLKNIMSDLAWQSNPYSPTVTHGERPTKTFFSSGMTKLRKRIEQEAQQMKVLDKTSDSGADG